MATIYDLLGSHIGCHIQVSYRRRRCLDPECLGPRPTSRRPTRKNHRIIIETTFETCTSRRKREIQFKTFKTLVYLFHYSLLRLALKEGKKKLLFRDNFYKMNANNFFRDRKWYEGFFSERCVPSQASRWCRLHNEFPELVAATQPDAGPFTITEIGCGTEPISLKSCEQSFIFLKVLGILYFLCSLPTGIRIYVCSLTTIHHMQSS